MLVLVTRASGSPDDATQRLPLGSPGSHVTRQGSSSADGAHPGRADHADHGDHADHADANASAQTLAITRPPFSPADSLTQPWHRNGTGPIPTANGPVRKRWRKVISRTLSKAWDDSLFGMSSQAAFWCAVSTAPLLLALLGLVGYVAPWFGPATLDEIKSQIFIFLNGIFNEEVVNNLVGDTVNTILNNGRSDVVSVGLIISLWAGSSAMSAFVESITIAYCQHEVRHPVVERFFALGLYLIALVAGILVLPLLAIGPSYLPRLFPESWEDNVGTIVNIAYYPVLSLALILLLATLYKVSPKHRHAWKRGLPGAFLAAGFFLLTSFLLRLYLEYVYTHGLTYGALATPITFLLFYYFVCMAIIIGAQFNNALLEYYPPRITRRELKAWRRYDPNRDAEDDAPADARVAPALPDSAQATAGSTAAVRPGSALTNGGPARSSAAGTPADASVTRQPGTVHAAAAELSSVPPRRRRFRRLGLPSLHHPEHEAVFDASPVESRRAGSEQQAQSPGGRDL